MTQTSGHSPHAAPHGAPHAKDRPVVIELNPRERRIYDRLRAQVQKPAPGERSGFRDLLLLLREYELIRMAT